MNDYRGNPIDEFDLGRVTDAISAAYLSGCPAAAGTPGGSCVHLVAPKIASVVYREWMFAKERGDAALLTEQQAIVFARAVGELRGGGAVGPEKPEYSEILSALHAACGGPKHWRIDDLAVLVSHAIAGVLRA
jgi:hypothetical protein